jgi:hypothetical protein
MPLFHSKSKQAFTHNLEQEMSEGKSKKQSLAIAYALAKKAAAKGTHKKMSEGGEVQLQPDSENMVTKIMKARAPKEVSTHSEIDDFDYLDLSPAEHFSYDEANSGDALGNEQEDMDRKDMVKMIMKQRAMKNSK